jgi:CDP-diacylglycerol--glycerol-3-phosphate 3-phosphatidyltransferase
VDRPAAQRFGAGLSLHTLKPRFQASLRPFARALADIGVTANQVTIATALVSIGVGSLVAGMLSDPRWFLLIPIWMFVRMAFNAIDGMLAREFGGKSRLGAYLNELADVVSDAALYAPFALLPPFSPLWIGIVIVLALLSEYAGALGPLVGAPRRFDGPMGKSDRALVFGALGLWAGLGAPLPEWAALALPATALALVLTILNRVRSGLREVD